MEEYGSILLSIIKHKKVIAIPRLHEYQEHVNNHQKEIVELFDQKGYIIGLQAVEELEQGIQKSINFIPEKYKQDNRKMLELLEEFIDNC